MGQSSPWRKSYGLLLFALAGSLYGQGSRVDYDRANSMWGIGRDALFRDRVRPKWIGESGSFWYRVDTAKERWEFVWFDATRNERRVPFDHAAMASALSVALGEPVSAEQLPIDRIDFQTGRVVSVRASQRWWRLLDDGTVVEEGREPTPRMGISPASAPSRSFNGAETSTIVFDNRLESSAALYWIDTAGVRRFYGDIPAGGSRSQSTYVGHLWMIVDGDGRDRIAAVGEEDDQLILIDDAPITEPPRVETDRGVSPDGRYRAYIRDHNVGIVDLQTDEKVSLSHDGSAEDRYRGPIVWSPNGEHLAAIRETAGADHQIHHIESSPRDQLEPKLHSMRYLKPGDELPVPRPVLFELRTTRAIPIDATDGNLLEHTWSLSDLRFDPEGKRLTLRYNRRGHQVARVVGVDVATGRARTLIEEESPTFLDYAQKQFVHYLDQTGEAIWASERNGWNHLYLYDLDRGEVKGSVTAGDWVVRSVERVDEESRQVWFFAGGVYPDQDPYYLHLCRANFDGTGFTILTEGDGTHDVTFSPNRDLFIDRWSRVDEPPVTEVRRASDGALLAALERADATELHARGWTSPERFVAKGRDGSTDIYGIVIRPSNFDPSQTYPVIEQIYAGPHGAHVPKSFATLPDQHAMAELGFIVVQIDGMGTSFRSKAFHDVCWKNLGDAGFPDRIAWMRDLAKTHPGLDLTRVGIYGGSAGGQNAMRALLAHGDFYRAAVADCGCHDNRMDKVWWNELWMGWPIGPHYAEQSNVTQAHRLEGKLLLIVGELDRNVDPSSTLQVVDALIRADKDFDFLMVPGGGHGAGGSPYGRRRRMDFFVRHLLDREPRWE